MGTIEFKDNGTGKAVIYLWIRALVLMCIIIHVLSLIYIAVHYAILAETLSEHDSKIFIFQGILYFIVYPR